ncbi:MAG: sterol desaturase family protein [Pseudomonadota bacterium]
MIDVLGYSVNLEEGQALLSMYFIIFAVVTLIAYLKRRGDALRWRPEMVKSARVNWTFLVLNGALAPFVVWIVFAVDGAFKASGIPTIPESFWAFAPGIVPAIIALIVADFVDYWSHRLRHTPLLWPIHAIHHSDTQMNYMTWYRAHILEQVVIQAGYVLLATLMGASPAAVGILVFLRAMHQHYVHTEVDIHHGPFSLVLASPRFHRWHHADDPAAYDKNLANIMPLWDRLFGTYYCPGKCDAPMGFPGNPGENVVQLLVFPFTEWGRMIRQKLDRKAPQTPTV